MAHPMFKAIFGNKHKLHITQLSLLFLAIVLSITRLTIKGSRITRAHTWFLAVCLKSVVLIAYQVLTGRQKRLQKWASMKANMIMNFVELVFWFVAFGLMASNGNQGCRSGACVLGGLLATLAAFLCILAIFVCWITFQEYRNFKLNGITPGKIPVTEANGCRGARQSV